MERIVPAPTIVWIKGSASVICCLEVCHYGQPLLPGVCVFGSSLNLLGAPGCIQSLVVAFHQPVLNSLCSALSKPSKTQL